MYAHTHACTHIHVHKQKLAANKFHQEDTYRWKPHLCNTVYWCQNGKKTDGMSGEDKGRKTGDSRRTRGRSLPVPQCDIFTKSQTVSSDEEGEGRGLLQCNCIVSIHAVRFCGMKSLVCFFSIVHTQSTKPGHFLTDLSLTTMSRAWYGLTSLWKLFQFSGTVSWPCLRKLSFNFQGTVEGTVPCLGTFLTDLTMLERKMLLISRAQSRAQCPTWALSWPTWPCWTRPWRTWRRTGWSTLRSDARSLRCWHSSGCCSLLHRSTVWSSNPISGSGLIPSESSLM